MLASAPTLQLKDLLKQLQVERDQYAENLKEENAIWQQKMQQMSEQVRCDLRAPHLRGHSIFLVIRKWESHHLPCAARGGCVCL